MSSKNRYSSVTPGLKMTTTTPLTAFNPLAKSNDGSPGKMYISEGLKTHFQMYLPGGYFCYNQEMCFLRCQAAPMLCSTKGWEADIVFSGLFDPNNGGMRGWTHSLVGYTSSDAFLGQTSLTEFAMVGGTFV